MLPTGGSVPSKASWTSGHAAIQLWVLQSEACSVRGPTPSRACPHLVAHRRGSVPSKASRTSGHAAIQLWVLQSEACSVRGLTPSRACPHLVAHRPAPFLSLAVLCLTTLSCVQEDLGEKAVSTSQLSKLGASTFLFCTSHRNGGKYTSEKKKKKTTTTRDDQGESGN